METFLGGLALAAISGVTYIAYRHPSSYSRLRTVLLIVLLTPVVFLLGSHLAATSMSSSQLARALESNPSGKLSDYAFAIRELAGSTGSFRRVALICLSSAAYVFLLSFLPAIIDEKDKTDVG